MEHTIFISEFQDSRWVITAGKDVMTSESNLEDSLEFARKHDISPGAMARAKKIHWPAELFHAVYEKDNGQNLFTDRGNRVTFDRKFVTDDDIRLALLHAQQKFGNELTLTGDDPRFKERMAQLADDMGLKVLNPELQEAIKLHRLEKKSRVENQSFLVRNKKMLARVLSFLVRPATAH